MRYTLILFLTFLIGATFSYGVSAYAGAVVASTTPTFLLTATETEIESYEAQKELLRLINIIDQRTQEHTKRLDKIIKKL